jgi:hypothetical protein
MRYSTISKEILSGFRTTLSVLEQVSDDPLEVYLYGLTTNPGVLAKAEQALEYLGDEGDEAPDLRQVAICLRLTDEAIRLLEGSGLTLEDEEFAYVRGKDSARTNSIRYGKSPARITDEDFTEMAIATTDTWVDDFLTKHGTVGAPGKLIEGEVSRDQSATDSKKETGATTPPPSSNPIDNYLNT